MCFIFYTLWVVGLVSPVLFGGLFSLIRNSWNDIKDNHEIDDRYNWLMIGVCSVYMLNKNISLVYVLSLLTFQICLIFVLLKFGNMGTGDLSAFNWINLGLFAEGLVYLLWFWLIMGFVLLYVSWRNKKNNCETALYPFITLAFVGCYLAVWLL